MLNTCEAKENFGNISRKKKKDLQFKRKKK